MMFLIFLIYSPIHLFSVKLERDFKALGKVSEISEKSLTSIRQKFNFPGSKFYPDYPG